MIEVKGLLCCAAVLLAAGCGKEAGVSKPGSPGATGAVTPGAVTPASAAASITGPDLEAVTKANKPYRLTLIVKTRNNPFFTPMIDAFTAKAKELGCRADVQAPPQESDKERQFALVQTVAARQDSDRPDAILIAPADSKAIVPALKAAQDRGILVVNLDNRVDPPTAESAGLQLGGYVGADNEKGGELAGEGMIEALPGGGKVAIIEGLRGVDNAEARKRGFETAIKKRFELVAAEEGAWDTQKAYEKCQSILAAHPDLKGIFCANDKMAIGAMKAIKEAGKSGKIVVIGFDNIPDVQEYLKDGEMYGTIEQHPDFMGKYGTEMAVGILNGSVPRGREYLVTLEFIKKH